MIHIALIQQNPHSDLDRNIQLALERAGMQAHSISWDTPPKKFAEFHGIVIAGHSSRKESSGIAACDSLIHQIAEQSLLGKPILGIDTGAHILVEAGLVPGLENNQVGMALVNHDKKQENLYVRLSEGYQLNAFTRHLSSKNILPMMNASTEGRFIIPPVLLDEIERNGLNVFQYCDEYGVIASVNNIAAISNKAGNVMAMVPHLNNMGDAILKSMREYITEGYVAQVVPLYYQPRPAIVQQLKQ